MAADLVRDYPAYPEDERSERARAVGFKGRYRGSRIVLASDGRPFERVLRITKVLLNDRSPGYVAETLGGEVLEVLDSEIAVPDHRPLVAALSRRTGGPMEADPATFRALVDGYVWMSFPGGQGITQENADELAWLLVVQSEPRTGVDPSDAVVAWSTRELCARAMAGGDIGARLPFLAACRVAAGRHVAIDPGERTAWTIPAPVAATLVAPKVPGPGPMTAEAARWASRRVTLQRPFPATEAAPVAKPRSLLGRLFGRD